MREIFISPNSTEETNRNVLRSSLCTLPRHWSAAWWVRNPWIMLHLWHGIVRYTRGASCLLPSAPSLCGIHEIVELPQRANNTGHISHKNRLMHTFIINTALWTLCHCDMFQPSNGHLQEVRQEHFNSKVNRMSYQMYKSVCTLLTKLSCSSGNPFCEACC